MGPVEVEEVEEGGGGGRTHPFGHVSSIGVVVVVLQDHHGGHHRHPHDDHDAGEVLACQREAQSPFTQTC